MVQINDLTASELPKIWAAIRALQNATPLNNASIGRSGMEIYDGGVLTISNGGLVVNGSAQIIGTLNADGTINMTGLFIASGTMQLNGTTIATGDFNIDGPLIVDGNTTFNGQLNITGITTIQGDTTVTGELVTNGPVDINGLTKITGNLEIKGTSTLTGDLNVVGSGKIVAGQTTIRPSGNINFGSSLTIGPEPSTGVPTISAGASQITLTPSDPVYWAQFTGGAYFQGRVRAADLRLGSLPTTSQPANLHIDSAGVVYRSTAA